MSLDAKKADLRAAMRALRRRLAAAAPRAADMAAAHLPLDRLGAFAVFSAYHAVGNELHPGPVVSRLADTGARLALPVANARDTPLEFRLFSGPLVADALGIPSPPPSAGAVQPDLVIAPILAFDRKGGRLGQGGGHFDRTLELLRAAKPVFVVGLAYAGQEVDAVPMDAHDQRLDAILTETGYIEVE